MSYAEMKTLKSKPTSVCSNNNQTFLFIYIFYFRKANWKISNFVHGPSLDFSTVPTIFIDCKK